MKQGVLNVFDFGEHAVRVQLDAAGEPLFVAKDVCAVLGILWKGSDSIGSLDEDERVSVLLDTPGGAQRMVVVNESGLYHLIFKSRKAAAKVFRRWVTQEVLPALRKEGYYRARRGGSKLNLPEWLSGQGYDLRRDSGKVERVCKRVWKMANLLGQKKPEVDPDGFVLFDTAVLDLAEGVQMGVLSATEDRAAGRLWERMVPGEDYNLMEVADLLEYDGSERSATAAVGKMMRKMAGVMCEGRVLRRIPGRKVLYRMEVAR